MQIASSGCIRQGSLTWPPVERMANGEPPVDRAESRGRGGMLRARMVAFVASSITQQACFRASLHSTGLSLSAGSGAQ